MVTPVSRLPLVLRVTYGGAWGSVPLGPHAAGTRWAPAHPRWAPAARLPSPPCSARCPHATASHEAFLPDTGCERRLEPGTALAAGLACEDVPVPWLTCPPSRSPPPGPAGAMGGCFSKPKPGDCPSAPCPRPAVPMGRSRSAAVAASRGNVNSRLPQGGLPAC